MSRTRRKPLILSYDGWIDGFEEKMKRGHVSISKVGYGPLDEVWGACGKKSLKRRNNRRQRHNSWRNYHETS